MSVKVSSLVWEHSKQEGSALLVLLALADNANEDTFEAWPSVETIAKKARIKPRQVQNILAKLQEDGELEVKYKKGPHKTNLYHILIARPKDGATECTMQQNAPCNPVRDTEYMVQPDAPSKVQSTTPSMVQPIAPKPSLDPSEEPSEDGGAHTNKKSATPSSPSPALVQELEKTINIYGGGVRLIVRDFAEKLEALGESIIDAGTRWRQDFPSSKLASFERWLRIRIIELETGKARASPAGASVTSLPSVASGYQRPPSKKPESEPERVAS